MLRTFVWLVLFVLTAMQAAAHSWYPRDCCSGRDCAPLAFERVRITPDGYLIDGRHRVPYGQAKWSPDEWYHGCFPAGVTGRLGCFWAPRPAM